MKFLRTMLRVGDLQRSIDFYMRNFGMTLRSTVDRPEQQYARAYVGYGADAGRGSEVGGVEVEFTCNYGVASDEACAAPAARSPASPGRPRAARPSSRSCRILTATRSS